MKTIRIILTLLLAPLAVPHAAEVPPGTLVKLVRNEATQSFDFDTPAMSGSLGADGSYHGVSRLVDKKSARSLLNARYSALNLFRTMKRCI